MGCACPTINGIGITIFACRADGETEVCDLLAVQIPDYANSAVMSRGMQVERDINLLASFECCGELGRLQAILIYSSCHLGVIYILLSRIDGCRWRRDSRSGGRCCGCRCRYARSAGFCS
jgi:hypothetical protein